LAPLVSGALGAYGAAADARQNATRSFPRRRIKHELVTLALILVFIALDNWNDQRPQPLYRRALDSRTSSAAGPILANADRSVVGFALSQSQR